MKTEPERKNLDCATAAAALSGSLATVIVHAVATSGSGRKTLGIACGPSEGLTTMNLALRLAI